MNSELFLTQLFSPETLLLISIQVTKNLAELLKREITIPFDVILNVLDALYIAYSPQSNENYYRGINSNPIVNLVNQSITLITQQVYSELLTEQNAANLSAWTTILGTNNCHGLRAHSQIMHSSKLRSNLLKFHTD